MNEHTPREPEAVAASFGEHLRAFHLGLPPDERALLEQVVALAEAAAQERDSAGYVGEIGGVRMPPGGAALSFLRGYDFAATKQGYDFAANKKV